MKSLRFLAALALVVPCAALADQKPGSHFMENWDLDGNGTVSLKELTTRRGDAFDMFDQDNNGSLNAQEYVLFDKTRAADTKNNAVGRGRGRGRMQKGLTLDFNDTNDDGAVSKKEFLERSKAWLESVDRDGDGAITSADFGPHSN